MWDKVKILYFKYVFFQNYEDNTLSLKKKAL